MTTSNTFLLDANVLIALSTPDHSAHARARTWLNQGLRFATCPITQGALVRFYLRHGAHASVADAKQLLRQIASLPNHEFWPDDIGYLKIPEQGIVGYRQVTDAYLVALASAHQGLVATMDRALAAVHSERAVLI